MIFYFTLNYRTLIDYKKKKKIIKLNNLLFGNLLNVKYLAVNE